MCACLRLCVRDRDVALVQTSEILGLKQQTQIRYKTSKSMTGQVFSSVLFAMLCSSGNWQHPTPSSAVVYHI